MESISETTILMVAAVVLAAVIAYFWIRVLKAKQKLVEHRRWVQAIPSLISTLGVLGTFFGITSGLMGFDTGDLDKSIPDLLEGLKTAFFTSLAGMICSMILTRIVSAYYDDEDKGISDINQAGAEIVKAVKEMSDENKRTMETLRQQILQSANDDKAFQSQSLDVMRQMNGGIVAMNTLVQNLLSNQKQLEGYYNTTSALATEVRDEIKSVNSSISSIAEKQKEQSTAIDSINSHAESMGECLSSITGIAGNIEEKTTNTGEVVKEIKTHMSEVAINVNEILECQNALVGIDDEINAIVKTFGQMLHGEVQEIEECMDNTNKLLTEKFDEFSELLKKSNTEALVEVMKKVTDEFHKQMTELIGKLVQENFDQLNKSVERLNQWQVDNKEMIASLTAQYKQMTVQFESTGTTLTKVGDDTKSLVSDGGKLQQIVNSLNALLIEDKKFIEISKKLESAASLTQANMAQFEESSRSLTNWVNKQRDFADNVRQLLVKLEEINRIRNYNEAFWNDTRKSMNEGVSIIKDGTRQLNQQLTRLDEQFYERLASTLAELDTCIQAMVNGRTNNNNRRG